MLLGPFHQLQAIHVRHNDIGNYDVDGHRLQNLLGLKPILNLQHLSGVELTETSGDDFAHHGVVINDQKYRSKLVREISSGGNTVCHGHTSQRSDHRIVTSKGRSSANVQFACDPPLQHTRLVLTDLVLGLR